MEGKAGIVERWQEMAEGLTETAGFWGAMGELRASTLTGDRHSMTDRRRADLFALAEESHRATERALAEAEHALGAYRPKDSAGNPVTAGDVVDLCGEVLYVAGVDCWGNVFTLSPDPENCDRGWELHAADECTRIDVGPAAAGPPDELAAAIDLRDLALRIRECVDDPGVPSPCGDRLGDLAERLVLVTEAASWGAHDRAAAEG